MAPSLLRSTLALLTLLPAPPGQAELKPRLRWQVSERAFVEFSGEETKVTPEKLRSLAAHLPEPAAGFYAHELDHGRTLRFPYHTLAALLPELALSLCGEAPRKDRRHRVVRYFDACHRFGRVHASGNVTTVDASDAARVRQHGRFTLKTISPVDPSGGRELPGTVLRGTHELQPSRLLFERVVDAVRGRVLGFHASFRGKFLAPRARSATKLDMDASWEFRGIVEREQAAFRKRVNLAIDRGQKYLAKNIEKWLGEGGVFRTRRDHARRHIGTGYLALVLMTLVKGNPDRDGEAIQACLAELRKRAAPEDTYTLATAILAIESCYESPNEAEQLRTGVLDRPGPRLLSEEDRELVTDWTRRLLENRDESASSYRWRFRYHGEPSFDNSCTQFAALGLASASRLGIPLPGTLWRGLAEHYLSEQTRVEGSPFPLLLESYEDLRAAKEIRRPGETRSAPRALAAVARGFSYRGRGQASGSMTCAGLVGLTIARGMSTAGNNGRARLDEAWRNGFAWVRRNYVLRCNPRRGGAWYYYYLYALERACELSGLARIDGRDWYFDGAMQLLALQHEDGYWTRDASFKTLEDTCFAILFLKKAVAPVATR
ncbi:MAG: hypothetical protein ACE5F1_01205 [Planctomycetota bacterium]